MVSSPINYDRGLSDFQKKILWGVGGFFILRGDGQMGGLAKMACEGGFNVIL